MNPSNVHARTIRPVLEFGDRSSMLRLAAGYRATKTRSRAIRWRAHSSGRPRTPGEWMALHDLRVKAVAYLEAIGIRDPQVASLLEQENSWHLQGLTQRGNKLGPAERAAASQAVMWRRRILARVCGYPVGTCAMCGTHLINLPHRGWVAVSPAEQECRYTRQWDSQHIPDFATAPA